MRQGKRLVVKRFLNIVVAMAWSAHFILGLCPHAARARDNDSGSAISTASGCCCGGRAATLPVAPTDYERSIDGFDVVAPAGVHSCGLCRCVAVLSESSLDPIVWASCWNGESVADVLEVLATATASNGGALRDLVEHEPWPLCALFERLLI